MAKKAANKKPKNNATLLDVDKTFKDIENALERDHLGDPENGQPVDAADLRKFAVAKMFLDIGKILVTDFRRIANAMEKNANKK